MSLGVQISGCKRVDVCRFVGCKRVDVCRLVDVSVLMCADDSAHARGRGPLSVPAQTSRVPYAHIHINAHQHP